MPGRVARYFYRNCVLLHPILSPLLEARYQSHPDTPSLPEWQRYLGALNAQFTLYAVCSVALLSASAGFAFFETGIRESTSWIVPLLARLAALQAFSAKMLALVMGTHLRDLQRMQTVNVAVAWLEASAKADHIYLLLQAPVAAMLHSVILLTIAVVVFLVLNPGMTFITAHASASRDELDTPTFPLWVRIVFSALFLLEAIHCATICHSFFKLGLPSKHHDEEFGVLASPTSSEAS